MKSGAVPTAPWCRLPRVAASDQFVDTLPEHDYGGPLAVAYDASLPPGTVFGDDEVYLRTIRRAGGPALELGTGNGRFLLPALREGLQVEGLERSADMLTRCRAHLVAAGLDTPLHHATMAPLALGREYAAIVCPASSFTLIIDGAVDALASWRAHLAPGGALAFSGNGEVRGARTGFTWRLRRTGTDSVTGITYVIHEASGVDDRDPAVTLVCNRLETYGPDGRLQDAWFSKLRLRTWSVAEIEAALRHVGFATVRVDGDDSGWLARARR